MRLRKKYQNGGGVPGGDPIRKAEQLAFARLLEDKAFEEELARRTQQREKYGVYADDPAGLPSTDPFLALTAAGDAEAIGSGLAEMAGGDLLTGGANVMLGAASAAIPGTLPKLKKKPRREDFGTFGIERKDPSKVGEGYNISTAYAQVINKDGNTRITPVASLMKTGRTAKGGRDIYEPYISGVPKTAVDTFGDVQMAKAASKVLDDVPINDFVGTDSYSTDSYPLLLKNWASGKLSLGDSKVMDATDGGGFDVFGKSHAMLNDMGKPYQNSQPVIDWHMQQAAMDPSKGRGFVPDGSSGYSSYDQTFTPNNQMDKQTFFSLDPKAKEAVSQGRMDKADDLYTRYQLQADNSFGISSFGSEASESYLNQAEAQKIADIFNTKMADVMRDRPNKVAKAQARGKNVNDSDDIPQAIVEAWPPGDGSEGYYIAYPLAVFQRNFNHGGKFKINKKRRPGMQVCR